VCVVRFDEKIDHQLGSENRCDIIIQTKKNNNTKPYILKLTLLFDTVSCPLLSKGTVFSSVPQVKYSIGKLDKGL